MSDIVAGRARSRVGFSVMVGGALIVLLGLGTWQMQRLQGKEGLIAERRAMLAQAALVISTIDVGASEFRRVRITGRLIPDKSLFVGPRSYRGSPGWYLVTPLRLATGGIVMINRGWVPYDKRGRYRDDATGFGKDSVFDGILRRPRKPGAFIPENVPARDEWYWMDTAAIAQRHNLGTIAPFWVVVRGQSAPRAFPTPVGDVPMPTNNHLQYSVTWFCLALALMVMGVLYWRKDTDG